jgi:sialic acid synthase SpsE
MGSILSKDCYIIAEIGVNHNGEFELAVELIKEAADTGVDAVKFQTFAAEELVTPDAEKAEYQHREAVETQYEMLKKYELSKDEFERLRSLSHSHDIDFISTPYDQTSVELLSEVGVDAYKIASADLINKPLIEAVAEQPEPLVLSTGMATLGEIERTMGWLDDLDKQNACLLYCVSCYPTNPEDVDLAFMETLETAFNVPVGFSDHTLGTDIATGAASRGATVIEKHFTLDRSMEGPDHFASITPDELKTLVDHVQRAQTAIGTTVRTISDSEIKNINRMRRSLHARENLETGHELTHGDLKIVRPFAGIEPGATDDVVGRRLRTDLERDEPLQWEHLE